MTVERWPITDRSQWLAWRQGFLCASEVGAAANVDPFRSALSLYAEKTGLIPPPAETGAMRRGRLFECAAEAYLIDELPDWRILDPKVFLVDQAAGLGATPDRLLEDPDEPGKLVNCQIKVVARTTFNDWPPSAGSGQVPHGELVEPPLAYQLQVTAENMLLDAGLGLLAVLVVGIYDAELVLFDIPRHAGAEAKIREIAQEFRENIRTGRRPAPDYSRDGETIAALFPKPEPGRVIDLSGDNRLQKILPEREFLKDRMDGDKKQVEALDAEIKHKLGDAEAAELPGWRVTWKAEHRREYTVPESTRRVLRVSERKELVA